MWKKVLWSMLSLLTSLVALFGVVRLGWTNEVIVAAGAVVVFLLAGLLTGNPRRAAVVLEVQPLATVPVAPIPELLDDDWDEQTTDTALPVQKPEAQKPARSFEWGGVPEVSSAGPSQF